MEVTFQDGVTHDITLIFMSVMGTILLITYLVFAYRVTHKADFYQVRRWKAALFFTSVPGALLAILLIFASIVAAISNSSGKSVVQVAALAIEVTSAAFTLIVPFLFVLNMGTYHQLELWLNSDDFLDRIWKDPNRGHKSPFREL